MGVSSGKAFIKQGRSDTDLYLILSGTVGISVHGTDIARRVAGEHIGEMTTLDPGSRRSATATAIEDVVGRLKSADFEAIAGRFPVIWRRLATVFIASSRESLAIAKALKKSLPATGVISVLWTDGVFGASSFPIDDLEREIQRADFGVVVLGHDDLVKSRRITSRAPRDNCVFELGLIMGSCGRLRGIILTPEGLSTKIPSDLLGLTPLKYSPDTSIPIKRRLNPAAGALTALVRQLGPR
jgi:CRP/FNR family cyclic AMP-dependent transcriptional regulator